MSVLWRSLSVLGLSGVSFNSNTGRLGYSYLKIAYCLFLVSMISSGLYFQVSTYLEERLGETLLHGLLYLYPAIADSLMSILIILSSIYNAPTLVSFFNTADNGFILQSFPKYFTFQAHGRELLVSAVLFVAPYFLDFFYYYQSIHSRTLTYQALSYIFVVYNYVALNHFSLTLLTVRRMYQEINEKVAVLCARLEDSADQSGLVWRGAAFEGSPFIQLKTDLPPTKLLEGFGDTAGELYRLRGQHHRIYNLTRNFNWVFALTNMGLVVHHGILGVINSYWGLRQALAKNRANDVAELVGTFRAAVLSMLSIVWLVRPATALTSEVDRTQELIQKSMILAKDKAIRSEVNTFSLQLTLDSVTFSPFGFFQLNNEVLLSMGSAIASYLVILLQYQIMLDDQECPPTSTK